MQSREGRPLILWLLDDGKPGHWSMTDGLAKLIAASRETTVLRIPVRWRPRWARQLLQRAEKTGLRVPAWLVGRVVDFREPGQRPDVILSRGGVTLFLNAWLARKWGVPNVFIGTIRGMPTGLFRAIVLQRDGLDQPPYFLMPLFPTRIDPALLPGKVDAFQWTHGKPSAPVACMFLGGDGSGYRYAPADWDGLANGMLAMHRRSGVKWCVASSRRTPAEAEQALREALPAEAVHEACWHHAGDQRPCVEAFLGASGQAFCTEDSMTMLEECIASGRPVVSLGTSGGTRDKPFLAFVSKRQDAGLLLRVPISDFAAGLSYPVPNGWRPVAPTAMRDSAAALLEALGL